MTNQLRSVVGELLSTGCERVRQSMRLLPAALTTGLLGLSQLPARAQFPINEPFTGASTSQFTLGGNSSTNMATLTGTSGTPGYLRLTTNAANRAGYAILNGSFPAPSGFNISFEYFSYGGSGADGISVFLVDADGTDPKVAGQFDIGAYGGSLGYAQKTAAGGASDINGVTKGYLGIGIDEYGNYSTSSEGRTGGYSASGANTTTLIPQSVALRGPVGASRLEGYSFLTGSGTLPFTLSVPTVEAQPGSADYRKAYINVVPVNGSYQITVRIQHGATVSTAINAFTVSAPPANLRVGFAASTGGANNYHEIRNLAILQNPFAGDDNAITRYGTPVTFSLVGNDRGIGAALDYASVDLNPATAGRQTSYTVAGQGTFTLNTNTTDGTKSTLTFTPAAGFAGVVTIPYVISDIVGQLSDAANISVRVTGADVATSVSGPASVSPGGQVTYRVSTTNVGTEAATNIAPTLQLPAGLAIPTSAGYTYNSTTGLVTFAATTLAAGASTSGSFITFTAPASGVASLMATSGYVYPTNAVVPDPNAANNGTSITTLIAGAAGVATSCATPGKDGVGSLSSTTIPNTYYPGVSVGTSGGVSIITVGTAASAGSATPVAAGDLVLVMQMQDGATMITTASSSSYGTFSTASTAGKYEYATVASVNSATAPTAITLNRTLTNTYVTDASTSRNFQLVRVPQYSLLTVTGVATGLAWDSRAKVGGVLALDVAGETSFAGTTPGLSMTAKGFAGGGAVNRGGTTTIDQTVYVTPTSVAAHGTKGEGIGGTPVSFYNGTGTLSNTGAGYSGGDNNRGAPANGGGGGQDFVPATNSGNSGGGGGGNAGAGGLGGYGSGSTSAARGNQAGAASFYQLTAKQLIMGGGGGAGSTNDANAFRSSGGAGGGIIVLRTGTVTGPATIQADGGDAPSTAATGLNRGGGGGGAGGTMLLLATPASGSSNLTTLTASAAGGDGGSVNLGGGRTSYGPGGGGGGGVVYASSALSATPGMAGGANGTTNSGSATATPIAFGATAGTAGTSTTSTDAATATNTTGGANACLPVLSVALSTSTPAIARSSSSSTPAPAAYTATISNVGNTVSGAVATVTMSTQFAYATTSSATLTMASGTTTTLVAGTDYVLSTTTASSPTFSGLTIPSGATLRLNFSATIAGNSVNGYPYQADASVVFIDPTRTATTANATPGGAFASGGGTVPGTNYAAASSSDEDVTLVNPLPVELVRFNAQAVRQSALLTWTTATEHNNDHFTVERSLTGSSFVAIGTVRGRGTSLTTTNYTFTDGEAARLATGPVYYRLRQVDLDGEVSYSPVRTVQFSTSAPIISLYPNPSQGQTLLDLSGLAAGTYSVQVFDLAGRLLRTQAAEAQRLPLSLADLPQGAYLVLVQGKDGFRESLPLLRD